MIGKRLLAIVLVTFLIVCFISAPVLCGGGDEDPWDVDGVSGSGSGGVGSDGVDPDSVDVTDEDGINLDGSGDPDPDGVPFRSIITKYGYGAWILLISWMEEVATPNQAVAGKVDGGSATVK
jgi:hypothetical protein